MEIPDGAKVCPYCGVEHPEGTTMFDLYCLLVGIIIFAIILATTHY